MVVANDDGVIIVHETTRSSRINGKRSRFCEFENLMLALGFFFDLLHASWWLQVVIHHW
jgi:hypothetical protein